MRFENGLKASTRFDPSQINLLFKRGFKDKYIKENVRMGREGLGQWGQWGQCGQWGQWGQEDKRGVNSAVWFQLN